MYVSTRDAYNHFEHLGNAFISRIGRDLRLVGLQVASYACSVLMLSGLVGKFSGDLDAVVDNKNEPKPVSRV